VVDETLRLVAEGLNHREIAHRLGKARATVWRGVNRVRSSKGKLYEYPRYQFCNRSDDIRAIFCKACDAFGIEWRVMSRWNISVARRESVAKLDSVIGPKF
jgi:hypothetical protein